MPYEARTIVWRRPLRATGRGVSKCTSQLAQGIFLASFDVSCHTLWERDDAPPLSKTPSDTATYTTLPPRASYVPKADSTVDKIAICLSEKGIDCHTPVSPKDIDQKHAQRQHSHAHAPSSTATARSYPLPNLPQRVLQRRPLSSRCFCLVAAPSCSYSTFFFVRLSPTLDCRCLQSSSLLSWLEAHPPTRFETGMRNPNRDGELPCLLSAKQIAHKPTSLQCE